MERVIQLLNAGEPGHALVRLWVLADQPTLNRWENGRVRHTFAEAVRTFRHRLAQRTPLDRKSAEDAPLALVVALDQYLADSVSAQRPSPRPHLEGERSYWLVRVHLEARSRVPMARQPGNRASWFRRHVVLPDRTSQGIVVDVRHAGHGIRERLDPLGRRGQLRIWVGHFDDNCAVLWDRSSPPRRFQATGFDRPEARTESFRESLHKARQAQADIAVFPELSLDPRMQCLVDEFLDGFALVVPGSFHERIGGDVYNAAPLVDGCTGDTVFVHKKLRVYGDVERDGDAENAEAIAVGQTFHVLVTPVGCMAILICKDFCDSDYSVATLLNEVPVDWVFVPSMGVQKTIKAHKARADRLARVEVGCTCVISNITSEPGKPSDPFLGFVHLAGETTPQEIPRGGGCILCVINGMR